MWSCFNLWMLRPRLRWWVCNKKMDWQATGFWRAGINKSKAWDWGWGHQKQKNVVPCVGMMGIPGSYGILWDYMGSYGILWDPMGSARLGKYVKHAVDKEPQRVMTLVQLGWWSWNQWIQTKESSNVQSKNRRRLGLRKNGWIVMFQWEKHQAEAPLLLYIMYMSIIYLKHIHI